MACGASREVRLEPRAGVPQSGSTRGSTWNQHSVPGGIGFVQRKRTVLLTLSSRTQLGVVLAFHSQSCLSPGVGRNVAIIGLGQLGSLFAQAFLRCGFSVTPVLREQTVGQTITGSPELIVCAVGEDDVASVLEQVPDTLLDRVVLLQNELRPAVWFERYAFQHVKGPTLCIIWFEKKGDRPAHVVLPSVLFGPRTDLMKQAFGRLDLPARVAQNEIELQHELALKNLYILGLNFTGLAGRQRAGELLREPSELDVLVPELLALEQTGLTRLGISVTLDGGALRADLNRAIAADPEHGCAGRSAPARLARTLGIAEGWGVDLPWCRRTFSEVVA